MKALTYETALKYRDALEKVSHDNWVIIPAGRTDTTGNVLYFVQRG